MKSFSLSELNQYIKERINHALPDSYWVVAEINEIQINNGHCYLELIEKSSRAQQIISKTRAVIWAYHFRMLKPYFESMTGQEMTSGLKLMFQAMVVFHEIYGLSLQITDINPAYTIGDLAIQKQAVIRQLTEEGVIDMNRQLELPVVIQRIAVISSETAAGYGDFIHQLINNNKGYSFRYHLFPALMQGNEAGFSIQQAMDKIYECEKEFDIVVIIRGGGSQSDLNCFNDYSLANYIAQFPIPVITGIGHDRDETIADRVACVRLKTPTAVAEFLIGRAALLDEQLHYLSLKLIKLSSQFILNESHVLKQLTAKINVAQQVCLNKYNEELLQYKSQVKGIIPLIFTQKQNEYSRLSEKLRNSSIQLIIKQVSLVNELKKRINHSALSLLDNNKKHVSMLDTQCRLLDPSNILQRGYSLTRYNGKVIRSICEVKPGSVIETIVSDGKIESTISLKFSDKDTEC